MKNTYKTNKDASYKTPTVILEQLTVDPFNQTYVYHTQNFSDGITLSKINVMSIRYRN